MKKFLMVFSLLLVVSTYYGQKKYNYTSYKNDPAGLRLYTLDNGLKVYLSKKTDEPKIQTFIAVRAGSNYDPKQNTGLAHYLEHMLFKGTHKIGAIDWDIEKPYLEKISNLYEEHNKETDPAKKKTIYKEIDSISYQASKVCIANDYDKMLSFLGAEGTNAHTWFEETVYKNKIPANELKKWLEIESERFSTLVLRLFHTELEAVYEEYNRGQDNEYRQVYKNMLEGLFPTHPYGQQSTIGTSQHLKNPSMVAIHNYFNKYYVPNNMAVVLVGDLDFDKTIQMVDNYFGKWKNKEVTHPTLPKEKPINSIVKKEVTGPSAPRMTMAYRFDGIKSEERKYVTLIDMILSNSTAGLIDLDLNQGGKLQNAGCSPTFMTEYGWHQFYGSPKEGQSLEEVQSLILEEIDKVKKGNFDDWMIKAVINDLKLSEIRQFENASSTASKMYNAFIHHQDWQEVIDFYDELLAINKQDLMQFAQKHYTENYVVVYKNQGENPDIVKVENPGITPIETNRGKVSQFAQAIYEEPQASLKPVFIDFNKKITSENIGNLPLKLIQNKENEIFQLDYVLNIGGQNDKKLPLAISYLEFLGTDKLSAEEVRKEFYKLGLEYGVFVSENRSYVYLNGLDSNLEQGIQLFEDLLSNVKVDNVAYEKLVAKILKEREEVESEKGGVFWNGLFDMAKYGKNSPNLTRYTAEEMKNIQPTELIRIIKNLRNYPHEVFFYGANIAEIKPLIKKYHKFPSKFAVIPERKIPPYQDFNNKVYFHNYDMVQTEIAFIAKDNKFNLNDLAAANVFNQYFGSGLSSIVFQEIRESKSLAYSAFSSYSSAREKDDNNFLYVYLGTQANKLPQAVTAMQQLLTKLPESVEQFESAKSAALKKIESQRITKANVYWNYMSAKDRGLNNDYRKTVYEGIKSLTFKDLESFYNKHVKGKTFNYMVIGNEKDVDFNALNKLGKVEKLSLKEIFN